MSDLLRAEASPLFGHTMGGITERVYCLVGHCGTVKIAEKTRYKRLMAPLVKRGLQRIQKIIVLERKQAIGLKLQAFVYRS